MRACMLSLWQLIPSDGDRAQFRFLPKEMACDYPMRRHVRELAFDRVSLQSETPSHKTFPRCSTVSLSTPSRISFLQAPTPESDLQPCRFQSLPNAYSNPDGPHPKRDTTGFGISSCSCQLNNQKGVSPVKVLNLKWLTWSAKHLWRNLQ